MATVRPDKLRGTDLWILRPRLVSKSKNCMTLQTALDLMFAIWILYLFVKIKNI